MKPAKIHLDQLMSLVSKSKLNKEVVEWLQQKMNEEVIFPPRQVTPEALDRLIQMVSDEIGYHGGTHAEEICEYLFGGFEAKGSGMLLDILTLARITLTHLRGANSLMLEPNPCAPAELPPSEEPPVDLELDKVADIMKADLRDALTNGFTKDARDLAAYVTASGVKDDLNQLRILASEVLKEAGLCECGVKFGDQPKCSSCGRLLPKERNAVR